MSRTEDPQRSPATSSRPAPFSRRLALGLVGLAVTPALVLAGCGNAGVKQRDDTRPEPNASTEGVRSIYPSAAPPEAVEPTIGIRSGPPSPVATNSP